MIGPLLASLAAVQGVPDQAVLGRSARYVSSSQVTSTASVSARIVRGEQVRLGTTQGLDDVRLSRLSLIVDGRKREAVLIEFQ